MILNCWQVLTICGWRDFTLHHVHDRFPHYLLRGMRVAALALLRTLIAIIALSFEGGAVGGVAEVDRAISLARAMLHLLELESILQGADHRYIFYYLILCGI
jgi:hypothetical protein